MNGKGKVWLASAAVAASALVWTWPSQADTSDQCDCVGSAQLPAWVRRNREEVMA
jgi:hypothetical protein